MKKEIYVNLINVFVYGVKFWKYSGTSLSIFHIIFNKKVNDLNKEWWGKKGMVLQICAQVISVVFKDCSCSIVIPLIFSNVCKFCVKSLIKNPYKNAFEGKSAGNDL